MSRIRGWHGRRVWLLAATGLAAAALGLLADATGLLREPDLQALDAHFTIRGTTRARSPVVVVGIDATSFGDLQLPWPFPRRLDARVLDRVRQAGARSIGYDVQFTEPTDPVDDNALINAVARARGTVLATTEDNARGQTGVLGGGGVVAQVGARVGNALVPPDFDGVLRRAFYAINGLHGFDVVLAERQLGRAIARSQFGGASVPIDYAGPPGTIPEVPFSRVLRGQFAPGLFRGRTVVIGPVAPILQDVHPTAASRSQLMSGAEVHANAVWTLLRGIPLRDAPWWLDAAVIVLMGALVPLVGLRVSPLRTLGVALLAGAGYTVATQLAFQEGRIVTLAYPLLALALATGGTLAVNYLLAAFERERVRDRFSRFVPEGVVDDVLGCTDEDFRLGGVRRQATVLFSDLRGFTSFSETLSAERVIEVVNVYLGEMSEAILAAGGTLVSYIGDGIMAVFGAPLEQPDHADRALAAGREMIGPGLERFNAWLRAQGLSEGFRMGVGLNSGEVMAGNVGSMRRLEYTVIGDVTNTASRLEGMTKGTPHMLLMADSTRAALAQPPPDLIDFGEHEVRGRRAKLRAWTVRSLAADQAASSNRPSPGAAEGSGSSPAGAPDHAPHPSEPSQRTPA